MDEFTPTTSDLCDAWGYFRHEGTDWGNPAYCEGFNRWLASVKAEAWDEGFDAGAGLSCSPSSTKCRGRNG